MRKHLLALLLVLGCCLQAAPMLTSFGSLGENDLGGYGLMVKRFSFDHALESAECLRVCEALDGSNCLLVNDTKVSLEHIFAETAIREAVTRLLERGGLVFISIPNWSWMTKRPTALYDFFKEIDAPLPEAYNGFPSKSKQEACEITAEFAEQWPGKPEKGFPILAGGHAGTKYDSRWKPLWVSSVDHKSVTGLLRSDVKGKGTVLVNYAHKMLWRPLSPFFLNMVKQFYGIEPGGRRKPSKDGAAKQPEVSIPYCDIRKPHRFDLVLKANGEKSPCSTEVTLTPDENSLKCRFFCVSLQPNALRANITTRDGAVWLDDAVELFIQSGLKSSDSLYHFIINSKGVVYDAKDSSANWNCDGLKVEAKTTQRGYEVALEIPFASLGISKKPFRANFCREMKTGVPLKEGEKLPFELQLQALRKMPSFESTECFNCFGFTASLDAAPKRTVANSTQGVEIHRVPTFTKLYPDYAPEEGEKETEQLQFTVARNDKEIGILTLLNNSETNLRYRVEIDPTLTNRKEPSSSLFSVKEILPFRATNRQVFWEIITPLNQAAVISAPGNDLSVLSIEIKTQLPPGTYKCGFTLVPVNADVPQRRITMEVEVLNLELPDKLPFDVYLFGPYTGGRRYWTQWGEETAPLFWQYVNFFKSYHAWTIHSRDPLNQAISIKDKKIIVSTKKEDYLFDEKELMAAGLKWSYHYGVWAVFHGRLKQAGLPCTLKDETVRNSFEEAIRRWSQFAKEEGIDFNRFWVPVWDEPRTDAIEETIIASDIVRKYGFKTNQTLANWTTVEDVQRLCGHVDCWVPIEYHITGKNSGKMLELMKATGKPIMPYMCSVGGNIEHYHGYFRYRGIREYLIHADGIALWCANAWRGNDYDSRMDTKMRGTHLVHRSATGPVPTLRLEALREGFEDFYWLLQAEKSKNPAARKFADKEYLDKLMEKNSPAEMELFHTQLLKALAQ